MTWERLENITKLEFFTILGKFCNSFYNKIVFVSSRNLKS